MKNSHIFTRQSMGLDHKVWFVMLMVIVLCGGLLGYRLIDKNADRPCVPVTVMVNGMAGKSSRTYNTNELLFFKASTAPGNDISWDFGDNTKLEEGFTTSHVFKKPGMFELTITVNGKCENFEKVNVITAATVVRDSSGNITENIVGPGDAIALETIKFTTPLQAKSFEWTIADNDNFLPRTTREAAFKFKLAGSYTVQLILDKDRQKKYTKNIVVTEVAGSINEAETDKPKPLIKEEFPVIIQPKKEEPKPALPTVAAPAVEEPKKPEPATVMHKTIKDKLLQIMIEEVIKGAKGAQDFDAYLCNGANTKVIENDKWTTFGALCANIKGKKIKIESIEQGKMNDCINTLTIKYKKKGGFLIF